MPQKEQKVSIHPYNLLRNATSVCKRCFKPISGISFASLFSPIILCESCINELNPHLRHSICFGVNIYWLYDYNEEFRNALYTFKGCSDYELKDIFITRQRKTLNILFKRHYIVPVPSFSGRDATRGYNHVVTIFDCLGLPFIFCLTKTKDIKQADQTKENRRHIKNFLVLENERKLVGKRILLVDDVMTTGSTIKACISLLQKTKPKRIDVLVLARVPSV